MFKILAGDYGNPPKSETWLFGQFIITPSDEVELSNFNCKNGADDQIFIDKDITKIQILKEEDFGKDKKGAALWALGGAVLAGPLGLAGGLLAGNKKEVVILIETRVGNKFIAKADEKSYRRILDQSNYYPEEETKDFICFFSVR